MQRILVANRGEIAVRIIHSIKKMGLETVALFHRNENKALHTRMADMAVSLGGGELPETYLNVSKIISIAKEFNCDAIHPGYGFLSENYQFARACEENGIVFIGPSSEVIRQMGSKSEARIIARKAGVPVLEAVEITKNQIPSTIDLKYPLIIKPALGGGGKGMKMVMSENDLKDAIDIACRESLSYFNNDNLIIEPYIENARHIEVQILGDNFGNIIHLFERECSIQRNHQKIIEEAPAVSISEELRNKLYKAAIKIAREIKYTNAGTVEFLVSGNSFYFLEMNTRIQVEHPVTEAITGIDIVEEQIRIAQNNPLSETLKHLKQNGHAIEARICAESSFENFRPSSGIIDFISFPTGPRVDSFLETNTVVSPHFDSMLAKVIVHKKNRKEAIDILTQSLNKTVVHGVETNISYLLSIVRNGLFINNNISTDFLKIYGSQLISENWKERKEISEILPVAAFVFSRFIQIQSPPRNLWQYVGRANSNKRLDIYVDGIEFKVEIIKYGSGFFEILFNHSIIRICAISVNPNILSITLEGKQYDCNYSQSINKSCDIFEFNSFQYKISCPRILSMAGRFVRKNNNYSGDGFNQIISPLFGKVTDIKVKENEKVKKGDILLTIESMKTENHILSPGEGIVKEIRVQKGLQVVENYELITLNPITENEHINN